MDPTAAAFEAAIVAVATENDPWHELMRQVEATRAQMETKLLQLYFACERERLALRAAGQDALVVLVEQIETAQAAYDHAIDALAQGFPLPPPDEAVCNRCHNPFTRGYKGTALNLCERCVRYFDVPLEGVA